jgi:hypothetical protein
MKITQEVREFARMQSQAEAPLSSPAARPAGDGASELLTTVDADKEMATMSERFREAGGELYVPTPE